MPKPNQVVSDKVTATDTLALIDEVKTDPQTGKVLKEYGVKIRRYKWGYAIEVAHPDPACARLEIFIENANGFAAVGTFQCGPNLNAVEVRAPGDLVGLNIKTTRPLPGSPVDEMGNKFDGSVVLGAGDTKEVIRDLNLDPTGNLLVKGEPIEAMIRRIVGEVVAS